MGGHGHDDHNAAKINEHAVKETDKELPRKIRSIDLVKHNPRVFHVWIWDPSSLYEIFGGHQFAVTTGLGGAAGWWYYA